MWFGYTHVTSRDRCHHDPADWLEEWHEKVHIIPKMSTAWQDQGIVPNTELSKRHKMAGNLKISTMSVKCVVQPMISEQVVPMPIEKISLEKRKLPRVTNVTGEIEETQPE